MEIAVLGGFRVAVDGAVVPTGAWGSRQARLVCKRLAVAAGRPVTRDELVDLLWPDELDAARTGARLSVVLSNVRRVLGGGILADREAVRLDADAVRLDLAVLDAAVEGGDDATVVAIAAAGPLLPEDPYDDWAEAARRRVDAAVTSARRRRAAGAADDGRWDEVVDHAHAMLVTDRFDERAHELLVTALRRGGRHGEAGVAVDRYEAAMAELGVRPRPL